MTAPFFHHLLQWYDVEAAALPWRQPVPNPYTVWLSEIMLQQTQVATVIPYYTTFISTYPMVRDLAAASLNDVLKLWEGLGYYSRARNLHKTAVIIAQNYDGNFPKTAKELQQFHGIGRYTANAIASISFGERVPVLDGNVIRVFSRLIDLKDDVTKTATKNNLWDLAETWMPDERAGDYNQALMELGRMVCKPRQPLCEICPLQNHCRAFENGTQSQRPVKKKKKATPHYDVVAGIIRNEQKQILIAQRPLEGMLGGLWEFPGGKQENGETLPETLKRELKEELDIEVKVGGFFVAVKHAFTHFKITLHAYECLHFDGVPQRIEVLDFAWVTEDELVNGGYSFGKADRLIIEEMVKRRQMLL
jgi:A/G-specific adenine glycosylase